MASNLFIQLIL
ncbi:uncharacterized protein FFM5_15305 [Fusarium fujikuroi]|nr:uncharacterized protein FFM5_15305 [Fusarium fujikuroi]